MMKSPKRVKDEKENVIHWTREALRRVENAPDFVRPGIYKLMEKRAKERGIDSITSEFLTEIRNESMMLVSKRLKRFGVEGFTMEAFEKSLERMKRDARKVEVIEEIKDFVGKRAQKNERIIDKFKEYLEVVTPTGIPWDKDSLDRLSKVPEHIRDLAKKTIEEDGKRKGYKMVTGELFDVIFSEFNPPSAVQKDPVEDFSQGDLSWTKEAKEKIQKIPLPFVRKLVIERTERYARSQKVLRIDLSTIEEAESF